MSETRVQQNGATPERFPDWVSRETMVLVFGAPEYAEHPQPITSLVSAFPHAQVIGCSTAGEIYGTCVRDESLSVAVVDFEHSMVRSAWAEIEDGSSSSIAGAAIAEELAGEDLAGVLVLSEGLNVNGTELARGITGTLGEDVVVTGGLAVITGDVVPGWMVCLVEPSERDCGC